MGSTGRMLRALVAGAAALGVVYAVPVGTAVATTPRSDTLYLDQGAAPASDTLGCLAPGFARRPSVVRVLYGVRQRGPHGTTAALVLRNRRGDERLCDLLGASPPSVAPLPRTTGHDPVAFLSNGRQDRRCDGRVLRRFTLTQWLLVHPSVDRVRLRFLVDGRPGPWFETRAHDRVVHLQAWLRGPVSAGHRLTVEEQVLARSGHAVRQSVVPTAPWRLPGCAGDGEVRIG